MSLNTLDAHVLGPSRPPASALRSLHAATSRSAWTIKGLDGIVERLWRSVSVTPAEAPLIDAENLFRQPGPPLLARVPADLNLIRGVNVPITHEAEPCRKAHGVASPQRNLLCLCALSGGT